MSAGLRISFQGEPGAFGEIAINQNWPGAEAVPARSFDAALDLVVEGACAFAVTPIWNTTIGDVREAVAAVRAHEGQLETCGEIVMPVRHALLALPGATLYSVRWAGSHFAALGQCANFFARHPQYSAVEAYDTAGAGRELAALGRGEEAPNARPWYAGLEASPDQLGIIANSAVADRYRLIVLIDDIQDDPQNATKFAILQRRRSE